MNLKIIALIFLFIFISSALPKTVDGSDDKQLKIDNLYIDGNLDKLIEINEDIKKYNLDWEAGFTGMECVCVSGCNFNDVDEYNTVNVLVNYPLPANYDWRNVNEVDWTTSIRDQLSCGSCVAFAAIAALESVAQIESGFVCEFDLSEAHLFFCGGGSCENGWEIYDAVSFLRSNGVSDEYCLPYMSFPQDCDNLSANWQDRLIYSSNLGQIPKDRDQIKSALIQYGPLIAAMKTTDEFYSYVGGVYEPIPPIDYMGNHAVAIVGYCDDDNVSSGGYWICKNSWGEFWGESNPYDETSNGGWFRIKYGSSRIEDNVWFLDGVFGNFQPSKTYGLFPIDEMEDVPLNVNLSWKCFDFNNDVLQYSIFFAEGDVVNEDDILFEYINDNYVLISDLDYDEQYSWRVDAIDCHGSLNVGEVYSFHTGLFEKPIISGDSSGVPGEEYEFWAYSNNNINGEYYWMFDWGDGEYSQWIGPVGPDDTVSCSHVWGERGQYEVRVMYMINNKLSYWSDPMSLTMPKDHVFNQFFWLINRLIQQFPILEIVFPSFG